MSRTIRKRALSGFPTNEMQDYERRHAELSRKAAEAGIVLLKNEKNALPLVKGSSIALFGAGATRTVKGGTGSGDVNARYVITIREGLENAGFAITTEDWLNDYEAQFIQAQNQWKEQIQERARQMFFFDAYATTPFYTPEGGDMVKTDADTALYVIRRNAGEGADRFNVKGDYLLSDTEYSHLADLCRMYEKVVVLVNSGGLIDLGFMDTLPIDALMFLVQPGMEAGNAVADLLSGDAVPSGKLADSWPMSFEDYPNAATFSHNNGNVSEERYEEGLYVGYRYFDTFDVPVRYGFGFGLSYTEFAVEPAPMSADSAGAVTIPVTVTNIGKKYSGKEVVQVYAACPDGALEKEARRLVAFAKTKELAPGEAQTLELIFTPDKLASYDEAQAAWVLEHGAYGLYVGNSLESSALVGSLLLEQDKILVKAQNLCVRQSELNELSQDDVRRKARREKQAEEYSAAPVLNYDLSAVETRTVDYSTEPLSGDEAESIVDSLTVDQLISLSTGDPSKGHDDVLGDAGVSVPGSAGETSSAAKAEGIANLALADGPAGLRLNRCYEVRNGRAVPQNFECSIEGGIFAPQPDPETMEVRFQNCTAIPVGALLAQTWDVPLVEELGAAIGEEMDLLGVTLWLAPGMNIHRNPLCGRNFEYYSEDPLLTGSMAGAMTRGVQSVPGCGTTIKHFACNNQEDNRKHSDSILNERVLREIYLKGFEIAIGESHPMSIMTSYNLINGVHSANSHDLCTKLARCEFGFDGVIMTDWTTTDNDPQCTAAGCIRAGNDLIMPGQPADQESIRSALEDGSLTQEELKRCITHLARVSLRSSFYEE